MTSDSATHHALIALGANIGEPRVTLSWAKKRLGQLGSVVAASRLYRTVPVGGPPGQADYLNAVVALETPLAPPELLTRLLDLEREAGRVRRERWGPRVLDLDLLGFDTLVLESAELSLPHPRLLERAFVLAPLLDVAPGWRHPATGEAARDAYAAIYGQGIGPLDDPW